MSTIQSPIPTYLEDLLEQVRDHDAGELADYIPQLKDAEPNRLALALCTVSGRVYSAGDSDVEFSIQSISKPFVYALALQELGLEEVRHTVGMEPSGEAFNEMSLEKDTHRPLNPMINVGAIAVNQLINGPDSSVEDRVERIRSMFSEMAGRELSLDQDLVDAELSGADRNLSLAHMLANYGKITDEPHDAVLSYIRQCAIEVTVDDLAVMAATLGNGGIQPVTGKRIFDTAVCRQTMAVMSAAGMYDQAGRWLAGVGIPAKSGVAGGLIGVLPGQLGIATFSPRLNDAGNSVRGTALFHKLSNDMGLHLMNPIAQGTHAVRSIESHGSTTLITLQGTINFAAAERIMHEIQQYGFSGSRIYVDINRVVAVDPIARRMLASAMKTMRDEDFNIGLYDPDERLNGLELSDGTEAPVVTSEDIDEATS